MTEDRCDLLCLDAPWAEAIREGLLGDEEAGGAGGELCVCDLAWISGRSQGLVSHHLRRLRSLVRSGRDGKLVMYELTDGGSLLRGKAGSRNRRR